MLRMGYICRREGAWKGLAVEAEKATNRHIPHPTSDPGKEERIFCRLDVLET